MKTISFKKMGLFGLVSATMIQLCMFTLPVAKADTMPNWSKLEQLIKIDKKLDELRAKDMRRLPTKEKKDILSSIITLRNKRFRFLPAKDRRGITASLKVDFRFYGALYRWLADPKNFSKKKFDSVKRNKTAKKVLNDIGLNIDSADLWKPKKGLNQRMDLAIEASPRATSHYMAEDWMTHQAKTWIGSESRHTALQRRNYLIGKIGEWPKKYKDERTMWDALLRTFLQDPKNPPLPLTENLRKKAQRIVDEITKADGNLTPAQKAFFEKPIDYGLVYHFLHNPLKLTDSHSPKDRLAREHMKRYLRNHLWKCRLDVERAGEDKKGIDKGNPKIDGPKKDDIVNRNRRQYVNGSIIGTTFLSVPGGKIRRDGSIDSKWGKIPGSDREFVVFSEEKTTTKRGMLTRKATGRLFLIPIKRDPASPDTIIKSELSKNWFGQNYHRMYREALKHHRGVELNDIIMNPAGNPYATRNAPGIYDATERAGRKGRNEIYDIENPKYYNNLLPPALRGSAVVPPPGSRHYLMNINGVPRPATMKSGKDEYEVLMVNTTPTNKNAKTISKPDAWIPDDGKDAPLIQQLRSKDTARGTNYFIEHDGVSYHFFQKGRWTRGDKFRRNFGRQNDAWQVAIVTKDKDGKIDTIRWRSLNLAGKNPKDAHRLIGELRDTVKKEKAARKLAEARKALKKDKKAKDAIAPHRKEESNLPGRCGKTGFPGLSKFANTNAQSSCMQELKVR